MAKVIGKAGRFVEEQTLVKARRFLLVAFLGVAVMSCAGGALIVLAFGGHGIGLWAFPLLIVALLTIRRGYKRITADMDKLERQKISFRKGVLGEVLVGNLLEDLPEGYFVINDLTTPFGNLDHVVIGPTGAFVIDTKNWRGLVQADQNGELLLNGRPTDKTEVKNLVRRVMMCREKVLVLCSQNRGMFRGKEPYIQAVMAFPTASVNVKHGDIRSAHCISDEQLLDYLQYDKRPLKLTKEEVEGMAWAFQALAKMDRQFNAPPSQAETKT